MPTGQYPFMGNRGTYDNILPWMDRIDKIAAISRVARGGNFVGELSTPVNLPEIFAAILAGMMGDAPHPFTKEANRHGHDPSASPQRVSMTNDVKFVKLWLHDNPGFLKELQRAVEEVHKAYGRRDRLSWVVDSRLHVASTE